MKIAVIILNYNGYANTIECISSLKKADHGNNILDLIVVDNASIDTSKESLSKIKGVTLIINKKNLGYAGGNNVGIKYALSRHADWILILNNDTIVDKSLISNLLSASDNAGIISPKIYFAPGFEFHRARYTKKEQGHVIWYAGATIDWSNIIGKHIGVDEVDKGQYGKRAEIDFATGACIFVKSEVFQKIGMFDEKYFLYLEDMDFCVRAKKAGYKIIFEPKAVIWHKNAKSTGGSGSSLQAYFITRNRLLFALKFARLKIKIALFKQILTQAKDPITRKALIDLIICRFGQGSYK